MPVTRTGWYARPAVLFASCALLAAQCPPCSAASAHEIAIEIAREGEFVSVRASAELEANPRIAWEVLTDYDHLAEFIPDVRSSRVLRRNPDDSPDNNRSGYDFWLAKLNQFGGDFIAAEMVKAFISSTEYRKRFGQ